jgi:hypothetical protein
MKTVILMLFSLGMITIALTGQTKSFRYQSENKNPRSPASNYTLHSLQINNHLNIYNKPGICNDKNTNRMVDLNLSSFVQIPSENEFNNKNLIPESGTERSQFFHNVPGIKPPTNRTILIKKPDTSVKYYLIIKDVSYFRNYK